MKNKNSPKTRRDDGENLGKQDHENEISENPAPRSADKESEMTPPENEVYVDLEPDELHEDDEPLDVNDENK